MKKNKSKDLSRNFIVASMRGLAVFAAFGFSLYAYAAVTYPPEPNDVTVVYLQTAGCADDEIPLADNTSPTGWVCNDGTAIQLWQTDGTHVWRASGNVGIGTATPNNKLEVGDGVAVAGIEVPNGGICLDNDGGCTPPAGGVRVGPGGIIGADSTSGNVYIVPAKTGNVGIGTTSPSAALDVEVASGGAATIGASTNSATGDYSFAAGQNNAVTGDRSGMALGEDNTVSGSRAVAIGDNNTASGAVSIAIGQANESSGVLSVAIGQNNDATDYASVAIGIGATASAFYAVALGDGTVASGQDSFASGRGSDALGYASAAMGERTNAQSRGAMAVGMYNVIDTGNATTWVSTDPIFMIGNGSGVATLSNAVTVLKNGNVGIGTTSPDAPLHVGADSANFQSGNEILITDGAPQIEFDDTDHDDYWIHVNSNRFYILPDNGAGTGWSSSRPFTIYDGRVGIGTATPEAISKLDVEGNIEFNGAMLMSNYIDANNIDHLWFDDGDNRWYFNADTTAKNEHATAGVAALGYYLRDWNSTTVGSDDNTYRLIGRDNAWMFFNGGVAVGQWSNDVLSGSSSPIGTGDLYVQDHLNVGGFTNSSETLAVDGDIYVRGLNGDDEIYFDGAGDGLLVYGYDLGGNFRSIATGSAAYLARGYGGDGSNNIGWGIDAYGTRAGARFNDEHTWDDGAAEIAWGDRGIYAVGSAYGASFDDLNNSDVRVYLAYGSNSVYANGPIDIRESGVPALRVSGDEAIWYNGTYFSWGYGNGGAATNYFNGAVGIGDTTPEAKLKVSASVSGDVVAIFDNTSTSTNADGIEIQIGPNSNPGTANNFISFRDGDGTLIGQIEGKGSANVGYVTTSDARLKTNISDYQGALDTLMQTRPVLYAFKSNPDHQDVGFLAQELDEVYPYVVSGDPDGDVEAAPMSIDYGALTPLLTGAIQELKEEKDAEIEALRLENEMLRQALCEALPELDVCTLPSTL